MPEILSPDSRPIKVLAIDDEPSSLRMLEVASQAAGFRFSALSNSSTALAQIRNTDPDVVLSDVMMPELDGFELCRRLKADPDTRLVPIVLITALDSQNHRLRGFEAGCDDLMTKPINFLELAARVRSLARTKRLTENLDDAEKVLESLARSVESKDATTCDHCDRLVRAGQLFGKHLSLEEADLKALFRGGILHDIGKIGVPDAVLLKPGKLDADEWVIMKRHPVFGAELLQPLRTMARVLPIVRHHHEQWEGGGYPDGLVGEGIPELARIFQILDAHDALTSDRPYRVALSKEQACGILEAECAKGKWDPRLLSEFTKFAARSVTFGATPSVCSDPTADA